MTNSQTTAVMVVCIAAGLAVIAAIKNREHWLPASTVSPKWTCAAREITSGVCTRETLTCPEPLQVAQRIDNTLFCKIKEPQKDQERLTR